MAVARVLRASGMSSPAFLGVYSGGNMKKLAILILLSAAVAAAQTVTAVDQPAYSDVYCSGFVTSQLLPKTQYVAGRCEAPHTTRMTQPDY